MRMKKLSRPGTAAGGESESGDGRAATPVRFAGLYSVGWLLISRAGRRVLQTSRYFGTPLFDRPIWSCAVRCSWKFHKALTSDNAVPVLAHYQVRGIAVLLDVESPRSCDRGLYMGDSAGGDHPRP